MLITCPKCGFSQPKDQYCAQCGVDMNSFRPPEKSIFQKAAENLTVQLMFIFLLGASAIYFIMQDHKDTFWSRMKFLRGSGTQVAKSNSQNQFSAPPSATGEQVAAEQVTETQLPAASPQATPNPTASDANSAAQKPQTKITFLEIPTTLLNKWFEDGVLTRAETSDGITIAYIPQLEKVMEISKAQVKVVKETSFPYTLNQLHTARLDSYPPKSTNPNPPSSGRVLANEANPPALVNAYATLDEEREDTISGQLEVSTNPQTSIPAHFEMTADQSFFMSGFARSQNGGRPSETELVVILQIIK